MVLSKVSSFLGLYKLLTTLWQYLVCSSLCMLRFR